MAHILHDRTREAAVVTGTGDFSLSGAVTNFDAFSDNMVNGDTCWYCAVKEAGGWEVGLGTKATGALQRTVVLQSSNSDALVNFGSAVTVDLFMTVPGFFVGNVNSLVGAQLHAAFGGL